MRFGGCSFLSREICVNLRPVPLPQQDKEAEGARQVRWIKLLTSHDCHSNCIILQCDLCLSLSSIDVLRPLALPFALTDRCLSQTSSEALNIAGTSLTGRCCNLSPTSNNDGQSPPNPRGWPCPVHCEDVPTVHCTLQPLRSRAFKNHIGSRFCARAMQQFRGPGMQPYIWCRYIHQRSRRALILFPRRTSQVILLVRYVMSRRLLQPVCLPPRLAVPNLLLPPNRTTAPLSPRHQNLDAIALTSGIWLSRPWPA